MGDKDSVCVFQYKYLQIGVSAVIRQVVNMPRYVGGDGPGLSSLLPLHVQFLRARIRGRQVYRTPN